MGVSREGGIGDPKGEVDIRHSRLVLFAASHFDTEEEPTTV